LVINLFLIRSVTRRSAQVRAIGPGAELPAG
jgi:hypothetical protein